MTAIFLRLTTYEAMRLLHRNVGCVLPDRPDLRVTFADVQRGTDGSCDVTLTIERVPPLDPDFLNRLPAEVRARLRDERHGRADFRLDGIPTAAILPGGD